MNNARAGLPWERENFAWGNVPAARIMKDLREKSPETYGHCVRVALSSERMAAGLNLPPELRMKLMHGCFLHDLGMLLLPSRLLSKPEPLTDRDWKLMKLHPELGAEILERDSGVAQEAIDIVKYHHERWDGQGYPYGLSGEEIPYLARICSVLDAFDCLVTGRNYRKGVTLREAKEELLRHADTQFDGRVVRAFLSC